MSNFYFVERDGGGKFLMQHRVEWGGEGPPAPPEVMAGSTVEGLTKPLDLRTPTPTSVLDGVSLQWVETATLHDAKANAWTAAKTARDAAESADFEFDGTLYQPDVTKITGAVLAALLPRAEGDPFAINWTVSDNSVVTLTAQQVMALGLTLTARINAIHQYGRELRALIENAATPAEAYGYTWNMSNVE